MSNESLYGENQQFGWTSCYKSIANELLKYKDNRRPLVDCVHDIAGSRGMAVLQDQFSDGSTGPLADICPFTTFALFNRGMTDENRQAIAEGLINFLGVKVPAPASFAGIPTVNNQRTWFFAYSRLRRDGDIDAIWRVFEAALRLAKTDTAECRAEFVDAYDATIEVKGVAWNLTMGLYWIRPWHFVPLDGPSRDYLRGKLGAGVQLAKPLGGESYLKLVDDLKARFREDGFPLNSFPELSLSAWDTANETRQPEGQPIAGEMGGVNLGEQGLSHLPRNQILYGPPGTGKTWQTVNLALAIIDGKTEAEHDIERYYELRESGRIAAVTFHQNFAYEDFIEGIRPVLGDVGGLRYERRDGLFKAMAESARKAPEDQRFVLIIDEINRGNVARIFGELITLIEDSRRDGGPERTVVKLPYSDKDFSVPGNLYLIGTMNTADRSIELLDTALRRRFVFRELMPDTNHSDLPEDVGGVDCRRLLRTINERITLLLDREHQIGHTYLLNVSSLEELGQRFRERIFPLLQEYFFDDWSKIHAVLGGNPFVAWSAPDLRTELADLVDPDERIWQRLPDSDPQWTSAAAYRAIYEADADADAP